MNPNIGIDESHRTDIAKGLSQLLAETYTLYLKTHKYHWNITGPNFSQLHLLFEQQYTELANAVDLIAERIRVLGVKAPGSYMEFSELSSIKDDSSLDTQWKTMIQNLLKDHETVVRTAKSLSPIIDECNDEGTNSLLGARVEWHEKTAWMLRSLLE